MKNVKWILSSLLTMAVIVTVLESCSKSDDGPSSITLTGLTAGTMDLNGATSVTTVPTDATFTATFSTDVDPATATSSNVTLTRDYDKAVVPVTVSATDKTVTIAPNAPLGTGSLYKINIGTGVMSKNGKALTAVERNFTTVGSFAPEGVIAYWSFENSVNSVVPGFDAATDLTKDITFVNSRNANAGKAASFNGTTSIVEIPNGDKLMANKDFTLSFWVNINSSKEGHFVMGLAGSFGFQFEVLGGSWSALDKGVKLATQYDLGTSSGSEDTFWNGDGKTKDNGGWVGSTYNKDVSSAGLGTIFMDKWAHVVCIYNSASKVGSMYVNGDKVREFDFHLWPAGDAKQGALGVKYAGNTTGGGNNFAIGFIQGSGNRILTDSWADPSNPDNNHFKGLLDDIRVFKKAVTAQEVTLMYNSEK